MKKKRLASRMISGLISAVMVFSSAVSPMSVYASEKMPEEELKEYVASLPELDQVRDVLDPDEIVNSKMDQNEKKYPVEKAYGRSEKYDKI